MAKMRNEHLSPGTREWLVQNRLADCIIRFTKKKLLSSKEWDRIEAWLRQPDTVEELARLKVENAEQAACLCYINHWKHSEEISVNPLLMENTMGWKCTIAKAKGLSK